MIYNLTDLNDQEFGMIWAALGELPAKASFGVMTKIKGQIEAQEAAAKAKSAAPVPSAPEVKASETPASA